MFVRWSNLTLGEDEQRRLPGYRDEAIVRRFDAPEALKTRFYEVRARSVLNRVPEQSRMPFRWTINPYRGCSHACNFCFARPTHKYLGFDAGRDFEREIVVKVNAPEVLRAELARPSWTREHVALGTNTDPYQWVEGRYRLMQGIWEALRDAGNPCSVLTKSPLLLRDLELMLQIAERTSFSACLSIPTLDEKAWRATEPHTPNPRARLEAVAELNRAGIPTGVLIAPLMPGINDSPAQVDELLNLATDAGAVSISGIALHLRGDVRQVFMGWLREQRPDLVPRYERLYRRVPTPPRRNESDCHRWSAPVGDRIVSCRPGQTRASDPSRRQRPRASRRCSELAHAGLAGGHFIGDLVAAGATADGRPELRGDTRDDRADAHRERGNVDLALVALDPPNCRPRDVLRSARADGARQLGAGDREHAGVADEPRENRRDAHAATAQVDAQPGGEAAQPELGGRVHQRDRGGGLAAQRGDVDQVSAAASDHRRQQRVSQRDRSTQIDGQRTINLVHREGLERAGGRKRGVGDHDVHIAGLARQTIDLTGLNQVDGQSACAELLGQRLEHIGTSPGENQLAALAGDGASDRVPDTARRARQKNVCSGDLHLAKPTQMCRREQARPGALPADDVRRRYCCA